MKRVLLVAGSSLLAVLLVEGALSLFAGRSLVPRRHDQLARVLEASFERAAASAGTWRTHRDPRVGYTMRPPREGEEAQRFLDVPATATPLGLRARPRTGEPAATAKRIVVLGDSVAFGYGLADDETIAARLEDLFAADAVACFTVALPGWNHRNTINFLLDHWDAFRPDAVVYLPIDNDLADGYGVGDGGTRRQGQDPLAREPLLPVFRETLDMYQYVLARKLADQRGSGAAADEVGPPALESDLTQESARRYDEAAASIGKLARRLAAEGKPLFLLHYAAEPPAGAFPAILRDRLARRGVGATEIAGFERLAPEITLPGDPHPNAAAARALAAWIGDALLADGVLGEDGGAAPLPVPAEFAELRAAPPATDPEALARAAAAERDAALAALQSEIDLATGRGFRQVYGGLNPDGTAGTCFAAVLKAAGPELIVRAAPLRTGERIDGAAPGRPLHVAVSIDGAAAGEIAFESGEPVERRFALPDGVALGAAVEVVLAPDDWTLAPFETMQLNASFRLVSLAIPPP